MSLILRFRSGRSSLDSHITHRHHLRGFTLVELLVVIGIISVLIAILLPALNKARQAAKTVQCASQMRQIALSILMYTQDSDGWCPPAIEKNSIWLDSQCLRRLNRHGYITNIHLLYCPEDPNAEVALAHNGFAWQVYHWGYVSSYIPTVFFGLPYYGAPTPHWPWYHGFNRFARKPILGERKYPNIYATNAAPYMQPNAMRHTWHNGGSNLAFGDGHVAWVPNSKTWGYDDPAWNPSHPYAE
jgi:prepilin-type N-terminal cleavage/methylation domain-containing protein/prepilin-type processing-associated H-X9-DG protein